MNNLTDSEIESLTEVMARCLVAAAAKMGCGQNCLKCSQFDEPSEICEKYGKRPPAKIIVSGCKGFEPLPF